jgi:hypothetical protein
MRGTGRLAGTGVVEVDGVYTHAYAYAESNGFLTLLSGGERLTGAYALGPEAGWAPAGAAGGRRPAPEAPEPGRRGRWGTHPNDEQPFGVCGPFHSPAPS